MADLVHGRQAQAVPVHVAAGESAGEHVAAVLEVVLAGRGGRDPGRGQRAVAEQQGAGRVGRRRRRREVRLQVDVQVGVGAVAEGAFHAAVVGVRRPAVVGREVHAAEAEEDLVRVVGV